MNLQNLGLFAVGAVFGLIIGLLACDLGRATPFDDEMRMRDSLLQNEIQLQQRMQQNEYREPHTYNPFKKPC